MRTKTILVSFALIFCAVTFAYLTPIGGGGGGGGGGQTVLNNVTGPFTVSGSTTSTTSVYLIGNATMSITGMTAGDQILVRLFQDATGSRTVTYPASNFYWANNTPLTPSGPTKMDEVVVDYDGTNYFASYAANFRTTPAPIVTNSVSFVALLSQYISMGNVFAFERNVPFSVNAWIKGTTVSGVPQIIGKQNAGGTIGYNFGLVSSKLYTQFLGAGGGYIYVNGSTVLSAGVWYQVTMTYDGSSAASGIQFYVNGVAETMTVNNDNLTASMVTTDPWGIGSLIGQGGTYFNGLIDQVSVFNVKLPSTTVSFLYNSGSPETPPDCAQSANNVGWYRLGESPDSLTATNGVVDSSPSSFNGTGTNLTNANISTDVP